MTEVGREIRSEIAKAVQQLSGSPEFVATVEGKTKDEMYEAAERLGADHQLLATIHSWGDNLTDEQVLFYLREWNRGAARAEKAER
jgi:hypothetical protein